MFNYQLSERKRCAVDGYKAVIGSVVVLFSQCLKCKWSIPAGRSGCVINNSDFMCLSHSGCSGGKKKFLDTLYICDVLHCALNWHSDSKRGSF